MIKNQLVVNIPRIFLVILFILSVSCSTNVLLPKKFPWPQFPWPPPKASAFVMIPDTLLVNKNTKMTLGDVALDLENAFQKAGYGERSYYSAPEGFALVSRLEQIYPDGSSKEESERWYGDYCPPRVFNLTSYLKALFKANPGHYRIIVFIVTSQPFNQTNSTVNRKQAMAWLNGGLDKLPPLIAKIQITSDYKCEALIYEWEQLSADHQPIFKDPSPLLGATHLEKAKLWKELQK